MFRYLARLHDRKHTLKSLQRQERIKSETIAFADEAALAFAVNEAEGVYSSGRLEVTRLDEDEQFYSPILPAVPLQEERTASYLNLTSRLWTKRIINLNA